MRIPDIKVGKIKDEIIYFEVQYTQKLYGCAVMSSNSRKIKEKDLTNK